MTAITGEDNIRLFQMKAQLRAIGLEMRGLKHSGGSVTARVKAHYGFKGNRQKVYDQLADLISTKEKEIGHYV